MGKSHQRQKRWGSSPELISARRAVVAECIVKGMSKYEIRDEVTARGILNPSTGEPYGPETIRSDTKRIQELWEQEVKLHYDIHVSRILGQIRAVRKQAWAELKLDVILKTLEQEVKLLGLDKATAADLDWKEEMRKAGVDPAVEFEALVQSAYQRMVMAADAKEDG